MSPKKVKPSKNEGTIDLSKKANGKTNSKQSQTSPYADKTSKILGAIFVIAGLTVIGLLILYFFLSRIPYRKDPNMPIPTLDKIEEFTKSETITITGDVIPGELVILYINGDQEDEKVTADDSGKFEFEDVKLEKEGTIKFEAATVRGRIFKKRSEMSNTVETEVDWTAPSSKVDLQYEETNTTGTTIIEGDAEEEAYIILRSDDDTEYETKTDDDGHFKFEDVKVEEGKNTYNLSIRDEAGNEVLSSEFKITNETGDLNGPGASTTGDPDSEKLPEAAGELEKAVATILENNLMFLMGLISLLALGASSAGVYLYSKKRS